MTTRQRVLVSFFVRPSSGSSLPSSQWWSSGSWWRKQRSFWKSRAVGLSYGMQQEMSSNGPLSLYDHFHCSCWYRWGSRRSRYLLKCLRSNSMSVGFNGMATTLLAMVPIGFHCCLPGAFQIGELVWSQLQSPKGSFRIVTASIIFLVCAYIIEKRWSRCVQLKENKLMNYCNDFKNILVSSMIVWHTAPLIFYREEASFTLGLLTLVWKELWL